jgi:hypothetical protein
VIKFSPLPIQAEFCGPDWGNGKEPMLLQVEAILDGEIKARLSVKIENGVAEMILDAVALEELKKQIDQILFIKERGL